MRSHHNISIPLYHIDKWLHHYNVWEEITYPFPNFNGTAFEIW